MIHGTRREGVCSPFLLFELRFTNLTAGAAHAVQPTLIGRRADTTSGFIASHNV